MGETGLGVYGDSAVSSQFFFKSLKTIPSWKFKAKAQLFENGWLGPDEEDMSNLDFLARKNGVSY